MYAVVQTTQFFKMLLKYLTYCKTKCNKQIYSILCWLTNFTRTLKHWMEKSSKNLSCKKMFLIFLKCHQQQIECFVFYLRNASFCRGISCMVTLIFDFLSCRLAHRLHIRQGKRSVHTNLRFALVLF